MRVGVIGQLFGSQMPGLARVLSEIWLSWQSPPWKRRNRRVPRIRKRRFRRMIVQILVAAFVLAAALRFVGLGFGRGVLTARADEELLRSGVLITLTGDLNPHYAVWGHLFHYIYSGITALWTALRTSGVGAESWTQAVAAAHCEPWTLIWIGRAISATSGVLTLAATYQLARRVCGSRLVAACSCVLLSTLFLHVRDSHFATSDVLLTLFCTAAVAAITTRGRPDPGTAGLWTGLALATKLLSATVVLTFISGALLARRRGSGGATIGRRVCDILKFLCVAAIVALVTQPFLVLDPMETWFGLFGDLFNPERRPFEHGLNLTNAKIILRYYVPQAMGWSVGGLAALGGLLLLRRVRSPLVLPLVLYVVWSLAAILSVQRIFLRYLDPLLPVACVLAAWAIYRVARVVRIKRVFVTLTLTAVVAAPNLFRDLWLDHHLLQPDTRALAGQWVEENVPPDSRILWSGYGKYVPHLTMPWLHASIRYDRQQHAEARATRGLPRFVDDAIVEWKQKRAAKTFWVVGLAFGDDRAAESSLTTYPFLDHNYDQPVLERIDRFSREHGLLTAESPRWDLMRRHIAESVESTPESVASSVRGGEIIVVTGMPCDPAVVERLSAEFEEVQRFDPGVPWPEFGRSVMYDSGDAWWLPNIGIHCVERPGPEVRIFRRRD